MHKIRGSPKKLQRAINIPSHCLPRAKGNGDWDKEEICFYSPLKQKVLLKCRPLVAEYGNLWAVDGFSVSGETTASRELEGQPKETSCTWTEQPSLFSLLGSSSIKRARMCSHHTQRHGTRAALTAGPRRHQAHHCHVPTGMREKAGAQCEQFAQGAALQQVPCCSLVDIWWQLSFGKSIIEKKNEGGWWRLVSSSISLQEDVYYQLCKINALLVVR